MKLPTYKTLLFATLISVQAMGQSAPDSIKAIIQKWVPDTRVAVANIDIKYKKRTLFIVGETTEKNMIHDIENWAMNNKIKTNIQLNILPDATISNTYGLIAVSVANLRKQARHSAELVSQAVMGTPIRILKDSAGHYLLQTPDKYIGWVTKASVKSMSEIQNNEWKEANRYIYTKVSGWLYADTTCQTPVSDVCLGSIFELVEQQQEWLCVKLPNGKRAYLNANHAEPFRAWANNITPSASSLSHWAFQLVGVSYLWGGTSTKMLDCSGFSKTIYFMNGLLLARDASQQIMQGQVIVHNPDFSNLETGDLLFFGTQKNGVNRVTHVGMVLQGAQFIHESEWVRQNNLLPQSADYSAYYAKRLLGVRRYIAQPINKQLLLINNEFYF